jgi:hypothetical protein
MVTSVRERHITTSCAQLTSMIPLFESNFLKLKKCAVLCSGSMQWFPCSGSLAGFHAVIITKQGGPQCG